MSAPVPYTCPLIDDVIETVKGLIDSVNDMLETDVSANPDVVLIRDIIREHDKSILTKLEDFLHDADRVSVGTKCVLETIRDANSSLRDWGYHNENEVEELKSEIGSLQSENDSLQDRVSELESQLDEKSDI